MYRKTILACLITALISSALLNFILIKKIEVSNLKMDAYSEFVSDITDSFNYKLIYGLDVIDKKIKYINEYKLDKSKLNDIDSSFEEVYFVDFVMNNMDYHHDSTIKIIVNGESKYKISNYNEAMDTIFDFIKYERIINYIIEDKIITDEEDEFIKLTLNLINSIKNMDDNLDEELKNDENSLLRCKKILETVIEFKYSDDFLKLKELEYKLD
ncbi:MAG: hypothetical protein N4A54_00340 [Peptostreptococcaceae bacterium]|jgi:hypothetical protein|nr:hypothetical protein [Peptostreptococcaceae bacterium]